MDNVNEKALKMKAGNMDFEYNFIPFLTMFDKNKHVIILGALLFFTVIQNVFAVEINTFVDRNRININESFQITFSTTETPNDEPDFTPLEKDFEVLNQSQQQKSSWINGTASESIQWVLNVMAKKTGNLTIPAISFGSDSSLPETILITADPNESTIDESEAIFLNVEVSPKTAYVQSQIIYTLKVYRKIQISQAQLKEPQIPNAIIEVLGEDKNYSTEINGVAYVVTERNYAIFPQKSGVMTISPTVLTAEVITNKRSRFNGFFNRQATKTQRFKSEEITLNINPVPANFTGKQWLPAEILSINEQWSGDINQLKVGEPVTRTLALQAKGVTVAQLPELFNASDITQIKTYPDQPTLKEQKTPEGMLALREEKIAFIPSKPGNFTLPAITVSWFNTQTQTMEQAIIPEISVIVIATEQGQNTTAIIQSPPIETVTPLSSKPTPFIQEDKIWKWISMFLACCLITSLFLLFKNRKPKPENKAVTINPKAIKITDITKQVKKACEQNNKLAAKQALLDWGKIKFNSNNLADISTHSNARLRDEIILLNQSLYAQQSNQWQGKKLFQAFTENKATEKLKQNRDEELEPLFKL